ncbi:hypothetical protein [Streptomyces sp. SD15]
MLEKHQDEALIDVDLCGPEDDGGIPLIRNIHTPPVADRLTETIRATLTQDDVVLTV